MDDEAPSVLTLVRSLLDKHYPIISVELEPNELLDLIIVFNCSLDLLDEIMSARDLLTDLGVCADIEDLPPKTYGAIYNYLTAKKANDRLI